MTVVGAWLRDSLDLLSHFQFTTAGVAALRSAQIELVPAATIAQPRGRCIVIPVDVQSPRRPDSVWDVPFGTTRLRLWNRIARPSDEWSSVGPADGPLWWQHESGTLVPAWNLWANAKDLLTFREQREVAARDMHGRFPVEASWRSELGLLDVPALNDANAAILDAAIALSRGETPAMRLSDEMVRPPGVVLSHDCDQLRGNDVVTQTVRLLRTGIELTRGQPRQAVRHLRAVVSNAVAPRAFFAANLTGMLDLERQFGFRSVSYFLTGRGGRYGARSGSRIARDMIAKLPSGWDAGVHYNYWTVGSDERLRQELSYVNSAAGRPVVAGRAHYLRFDPTSDLTFVERNGIRFDESVGWPGVLSYRAGIAGPFFAFDMAGGRVIDVLEMPLACMDAALLAHDTDGGFERLWGHLCAVGGVLSVLVHPGAFHNPESPRYTGLYERILSRVYSDGGRSWTPTEMLAAVGAWRETRRAT